MITEPIKVLDHGYVKFIGSMGTDETVIESARMLTGKGFLGWSPSRRCTKCGTAFIDWEKDYSQVVLSNDNATCAHNFVDTKGDASLLEFLYKNQHHTPFEMCELAVEVKAPIFVFREWHRHRTQSFNEFSARYSQMPNEHYVPSVERFTPKQTANKQESSALTAILIGDRREGWRKVVYDEQASSYSEYEAMIAAGVPKEVARINTPVSRYSKMRAKTDLRNWLGFLKLRLDPAAQFEIRQYAQAVASIVKEVWPRTYALFEEYTLGAVTLSATEADLLRGVLGSCAGPIDDSPQWSPEAEALVKRLTR